MYNAWLLGLADNLGAPVELLLRMLDTNWLDYYGSSRDLPVEVLDAIVARGSGSARYHLTRNPYVDPEQRARIVASLEAAPDDELLRAGLMCGPMEWYWPRPLPVWAIERIGLTLDFERDKRIIDDARTGSTVPGPVVRSFWNHREPQLRAWSCLYWPQLSDAVREGLLADPDTRVRAGAEAAAHPFAPGDFDYSRPKRPFDHGPYIMTPDEQWRRSRLLGACVSHEVVDHVLASRPADGAPGGEWLEDLSCLAANPEVPADYLPQFLAHGCGGAMAGRPDLTPELIRALSDHADEDVRKRLVANPLLSEKERSTIEIDHAAPRRRLGMMDIHGSPPDHLGGLISQATSAVAYARQVAASNRFLPAEYVARLAQDDDLEVRAALCMRHPEAPPELLARTWGECPNLRTALMSRPDFPRDVARGLARHAADPDPDVRVLVTYDPALAPAVADRLSHDADRTVATNAMRHPNLPPARIRELLTDPGVMPWFVSAAAANPALPVEDMYRILEEQIARGGY